MNAVTPDLFLQWLLSASMRASVLVLAVAGLQLSLGRWIPARWRYALWLPVVFVLLAPMLPESRFSFQNYFASQPVPLAQPAILAFAGPDLSAATSSDAAPVAIQRSVRPYAFFAVWLLGLGTVLVVAGIGHRRSPRRIALGAVATGPEI